jgi:hypothetical protein
LSGKGFSILDKSGGVLTDGILIKVQLQIYIERES